MKHCPKCKKTYNDSWKFCLICSIALLEVETGLSTPTTEESNKRDAPVKKTDAFKRFLLSLYRVVAAFLLLVFVSVGAWKVENSMLKRKIEGIPPGTFPVLILMPGTKEGQFEAKIIPYKDLSSYQQEFKNLKFLVPPHLAKALQDQLDVSCQEVAKLHRQDYEKYPEDCFSSSFDIEGQTANRQSLRVSYMWDDDRPNTGWYDATDKEIFPKFYEAYFGPGVVMWMFPVELAITMLLWQLITKGYRRLKSKILDTTSQPFPIK